MDKKILIDTLGWGILIWLFGYILGIVFFAFVPASLIGWVIMPFGIAITLFVLFKKIKSTSLNYYFLIAAAWTAIAVLFDYIFLVKLFHPADGYYKLDVYIYYALTFLLPLSMGYYKSKK
jgi:hypothetical protein